jgi:XRE family transcriptional regulator, aerobic/anaerobic benzoate catabolism transcriptional regulator
MHYSALMFHWSLGQRLRSLRLERGLSQKQVCAAAGVSPRFLVQVENGEANPSVARLAALAGPLGVTLSDLFAGLGPNTRRKVALVGLRGAGKSTVGERLARRQNCPFVVLDREVERVAGMSLAEVFEFHGADRYRELAKDVLDEVLARPGDAVVEVGGSLVTDEALYGALRQRCRVVWLQASPSEHLRRVREQGDLRPMRGRADALGELEDILAIREPLYGLAEVRLDTERLGITGAVEALLA